MHFTMAPTLGKQYRGDHVLQNISLSSIYTLWFTADLFYTEIDETY